MFNLKNGWAVFAALCLLLTAVNMQATNHPTADAFNECACNAPTNIVKTGQTTTSVSFSWDAVSGATGYEVWYVRMDDNYTSAHTTVTSTSASFTGLTSGRYVFYISTICGDGASGIIVLEDILIA